MDASTPNSRLRKPAYNFTCVPNALLRDASVSLKAKGLYSLMFSKPDDWIFHEEVLVRESKDGRDAVRSALDELELGGWLTRTQSREGGSFGHTIFQLHTVAGKPVDGKTVDGKSAPTNTDNTNTELSNPSVSPQSTKASRRGPTAASRLEEFLSNSGGLPPTAWGVWSNSELGWDAERIQREWIDFHDYWTSGNAVHGGRKADWPATWRSHCRRSANRGGSRANGSSLDRGLAGAMRASVAQRHGAAQPGGDVSGRTATGNADADNGGTLPAVPAGEIAF